MFSEQELAFLRTQSLARLATVAVNGQPDADAVGFAFEAISCPTRLTVWRGSASVLGLLDQSEG